MVEGRGSACVAGDTGSSGRALEEDVGGGGPVKGGEETGTGVDGRGSPCVVADIGIAGRALEQEAGRCLDGESGETTRVWIMHSRKETWRSSVRVQTTEDTRRN